MSSFAGSLENRDKLQSAKGKTEGPMEYYSDEIN